VNMGQQSPLFGELVAVAKQVDFSAQRLSVLISAARRPAVATYPLDLLTGVGRGCRKVSSDMDLWPVHGPQIVQSIVRVGLDRSTPERWISRISNCGNAFRLWSG
jgi:hypothetical protein